MEKILLAIDGASPDKNAVRYAVELCKRIKAELNILQIVNSLDLGGRVNRVRRYIEGTMTSVTFAEAGEHEIAKELRDQALENLDKLIPEAEKEALHCNLSMKAGSPDKEIVNYVDEHRDVVLTIYNTPDEESGDAPSKRKARDEQKRIIQHLSTPLVIVKG